MICGRSATRGIFKGRDVLALRFAAAVAPHVRPAAVRLLAGWDQVENRGRIFSYDPTGGRYEEREFVPLHRLGLGIRPLLAEEAAPQ